MNDLFNDAPDKGHLLLEDKGKLTYFTDWLDPSTSESYFEQLLQELAWETETLSMYGKAVATPRLVAWYGDAAAIYTYSGKTHYPLPWHPCLLEIRNRLVNQFQSPVNSVLANLYRHGHDSMGWHADNEAGLGKDPSIFSLSLGASRFFDVRRKQQVKEKFRINLDSGSLLVMSGAFQKHWQHQIPRQLKLESPRINLTFRYIQNNKQS